MSLFSAIPHVTFIVAHFNVNTRSVVVDKQHVHLKNKSYIIIGLSIKTAMHNNYRAVVC